MTDKKKVIIVMSDFHLGAEHPMEDYKKWCDKYLPEPTKWQRILTSFEKIQGNLIWGLKKKRK